jgi:hypothetical protein
LVSPAARPTGRPLTEQRQTVYQPDFLEAGGRFYRYFWTMNSRVFEIHFFSHDW